MDRNETDLLCSLTHSLFLCLLGNVMCNWSADYSRTNFYLLIHSLFFLLLVNVSVLPTWGKQNLPLVSNSFSLSPTIRTRGCVGLLTGMVAK